MHIPTTYSFTIGNFRHRRLALALSQILAVGAMASAQAATITADGTTCTLVDAITAANSDTATGGCTAGSGADVIELTASTYTLNTVNNTANGSNGLPSITSTITLNGNGATIGRGGGAPAFRLFRVAPSGDLTLNGVTLENGSADDGIPANNVIDDDGGAILNQGGMLTVSGCVFRNNGAIRDGGAIRTGGASSSVTIASTTFEQNFALRNGGSIDSNNSTVIIDKSRFRLNSAVNRGGAIDSGGPSSSLTVTDSDFTQNSSTGGGAIDSNSPNATVSGSTFDRNNAASGGSGDGGAIHNNVGGNLTVINSTFSANSASDQGGGIFSNANATNPSTLIVRNSTLFGNSATAANGGGGIRVTGGTYSSLTLTNTIVFGSTQQDCRNTGAAPTVLNNFIADNISCGVSSTSDPLLGPLVENGGPTRTHSLLPGSPAINNGNNSVCPATDQRGFPRTDGSCDVGAVESAALPTFNLTQGQWHLISPALGWRGQPDCGQRCGR
ncbi:MAG: choice-of-anchor Q domain-containing protein [Candidatus Competibacteraceae bacterium]